MNSPLSRSLSVLRSIETASEQKGVLHDIHPLAKVLITLLYLLFLMSVPKYSVMQTLCAVLYPAVLLPQLRLPVKTFFTILVPLLMFFAFFGVINMFLDTGVIPVFLFGSMTGGTASFITIVSKGVLSFFAAFILMLTSSIEEICAALRSIKVPQIICTQILLMYRYLHTILTEASRMYDSYSLRAPRQKGIELRAWGSFIGQLLLRSIDKAETVYQSMMMRGFTGSFPNHTPLKWKKNSYIYFYSWIALFIVWKIV